MALGRFQRLGRVVEPHGWAIHSRAAPPGSPATLSSVTSRSARARSLVGDARAPRLDGEGDEVVHRGALAPVAHHRLGGPPEPVAAPRDVHVSAPTHREVGPYERVVLDVEHHREVAHPPVLDGELRLHGARVETFPRRSLRAIAPAWAVKVSKGCPVNETMLIST